MVAEAAEKGAREDRACDVLGIEARTLQRWRKQEVGDDGRLGPKTIPKNALTEKEKTEVLAVANTVEHRDMSPKQIVPRLADRGVYIASESTFYRLLHDAKQMSHRGRAKPQQKRHVPLHVATGPNRVWVWDITYLPTTVRGAFYYLYMMVDLFSRKVMGWAVYEVESMDLSAELLDASIQEAGAESTKLTLHADNGGPMKGSTMLATMQRLGVMPSFSRPRVSDDNAYAESFFRHLKYSPSWPSKPFAAIEDARAWVAKFVQWYNTEHRHSGIQFVTPFERHERTDQVVLDARHVVYETAKARHPERWSGTTRDWTPAGEVALTPAGKAARAAATSRATGPRRRPQLPPEAPSAHRSHTSTPSGAGRVKGS